MVLLHRRSAQCSIARALFVVLEEELHMPPGKGPRIEPKAPVRVLPQKLKGTEEKLAAVLLGFVGNVLVFCGVAPVVLRQYGCEHEAPPLRLKRPSAEIDQAQIGLCHRSSFQAEVVRGGRLPKARVVRVGHCPSGTDAGSP